MLKYDHLLGLEFDHGHVDCYSLVRNFYWDNFGIRLTDYARPENWWDHDLNLYADNFHREGFRVLDVHPVDWQPGDVFLMAIKSPVANHAAVLLPQGQIIHHFYGRRSIVEPYRYLWRNTTTHVRRHKDVVLPEVEDQVNLMELLPDAVRQRLAGFTQGTGGTATE